VSLNHLPKDFPCPTCAEPKVVNLTKKEKPYYFCDDCGVQVFIRGKNGIKNLLSLRLAGLNKILDLKNLDKLYSAINIFIKINNLSLKFQELDSIFFISKEEKELKNILKSNIEDLRAEYNKLIK